MSSSAHFLSLLRTKVSLNLQSEAKKNQLGYAWWLLEPLLQTGVFYLVFGLFLSRGQDNFVAYLLSGLIPFTWYARSVSNAMGSLLSARGLLVNFRIHPAFFPLLALGQDLAKQSFTFTFLLGFIFFYGIEPTEMWMYLPLIMALQFMLVAPVACFVASIIPLLPDLKFLVATTIQLTMFASGIFYDPAKFITEQWKPLFYANPIASLLQIYRDILLWQKPPEVYFVVVVISWALVFGVMAYFSIRWNRNRYVRLVLQ